MAGGGNHSRVAGRTDQPWSAAVERGRSTLPKAISCHLPPEVGNWFAAYHHASGSPRGGLFGRRVIDLKIVKLAAVTGGLAGDAEFKTRLGGVGDARRLEVTDGFAVEDDADLVVDDLKIYSASAK